MISVLIPARNEPFLNKTIECVLESAASDVEVLVLLDGDPPAKPIPDWQNVRVLTNSKPQGIAAASWRMANEAKGEYIMKLDAHCLLASGGEEMRIGKKRVMARAWDEALLDHCGPNDLLVPARYQLKADNWERGYGPIHYMFVTFPWLIEEQFGWGMHGKKWAGPDGLRGNRAYFWPEKARKDAWPVDEIMAFQGSLWFMRRQRFLDLGGVDRRYWLWQESQDIGLKVWLSGGRVLRDKSTWYAHLHKGKKHGRGYFINIKKMHGANKHSAYYWFGDKWEHPLKVRTFHDWVENFWPIPSWPDDWDDPRYPREWEELMTRGTR